MKKKLFELQLRESIGEYEHTHYCLLVAATIKSATKKAKKYASTFYGVTPVKPDEDGYYGFNCNQVWVDIYSLNETTKEQWLEEAFKRSMIE